MRKKLIAGNWKMNNDVEESLDLVKTLKTIDMDKNINILICPPFTSLYAIINELKDSFIKVGAQNMHFENKGAYTGEISPAMLKNMGVEYVIIGHSERRQHFYETDDIINKKVKAALNCGLKPILCVGETLEQREKGIEKETVRNQLIDGLAEVENPVDLVVAYEPVWAIGTGRTATSDQANEMASFIRDVIKEIYSEKLANTILIQYGGSVNPSNANEIMCQPHIDGALVGGASLKVYEFVKIVNYGY